MERGGKERRTEKNSSVGIDRGWEGGRTVQREEGKEGQKRKGQVAMKDSWEMGGKCRGKMGKAWWENERIEDGQMGWREEEKREKIS